MMKCFLPCFCANSKRTKHFRSQIATPTATSEAHTHVAEGALEPVVPLTQQNNVEEPIDCIIESKEEQEKAAREEEIPHIGEKKDEHEEDQHEVNESSLQEECSESLFSLSIDSRKQVSTDIEVNSPIQQQHPDTRKEEYEEKPNCIDIRKVNPNEIYSAKELIKMLEENNEEKVKEAREWNQHEYRYHDCCSEGYEDVNVDESDFDVTFEDDDPHNEKKREREEGNAEHVNGTKLVQEESSESLFSLSIDSRKRISSAENVDNEVNSLIIMPPHVTEEEESQGVISDVTSVLNPIENVTQEGNVVKATVCKMSQKNNKENINSIVQDIDIDIPISPEPNLKFSNHKARKKKFNDKKQEIGVDTSLSSWLVEPETTPISINSTDYYVGEHTPKEGRGSLVSHEDRPILGALSIEEIRKYCVSISSRRSRSRSPDETPIIGTVGSYWSHTGQTMDSELKKHQKDRKPKCSTTLKTRLERAFEAEV